jgi:hypothetical protein
MRMAGTSLCVLTHGAVSIIVWARQLAEEQFYARRDIRTVALIRNRRILDVFDGKWLSDSADYQPDSAA